MNNTKSVIDSFPIHDNRVYPGKENNLRSKRDMHLLAVDS